MSKLNIFEAVKQHVTTRQAASFYGLKVNKSGMCCCPFHHDKTPSMKVDTRYHCFGCGADGDVISFVQRLFNLKPYLAARKLAEDFNIFITDNMSGYAGRSGFGRRKESIASPVIRPPDLDADFRAWTSGAVKTLIDYSWLIREWKEKYAPSDPEDEWNPLFCEALKNETKTEYYLDILMFGSRDEQHDFYEHERKVVDTIEKRIRECREHGQEERDPGSVRTSGTRSAGRGVPALDG